MARAFSIAASSAIAGMPIAVTAASVENAALAAERKPQSAEVGSRAIRISTLRLGSA